MTDSTNRDKFPFSSILNLRLLIEYWENAVREGNVPGFGNNLLQEIERAPELKQPIYDSTILEKHKALIRFLLTAVIPSANEDTDIAAAMFPFEFKALHATRAFEKRLRLEDVESCVTVNLPDNRMVLGKAVKACLLILQKFYNVKVGLEKPIHFTVRDSNTGLDKVYRVEINHQFCEIIAKREIRPIESMY